MSKHVTCDFDELKKFLKRIEEGCEALSRADGEQVVLDGQFVDGKMESGKVVLSETDDAAMSEHQYEMTKLRQNTSPVDEEILNRYARDLVKKAFGV